MRDPDRDADTVMSRRTAFLACVAAVALAVWLAVFAMMPGKLPDRIVAFGLCLRERVAVLVDGRVRVEPHWTLHRSDTAIWAWGP
jgi:hypothetical protein